MYDGDKERRNIPKNVNVTYDDALLPQQAVFTWSLFPLIYFFLFVSEPLNTKATTHFFSFSFSFSFTFLCLSGCKTYKYDKKNV
jgi:hypothetical protein